MSRRRTQVCTIEYIYGHKRVGGVNYYLIKWKGWSLEHSTWEPWAHIMDPSATQLGQMQVVKRAWERRAANVSNVDELEVKVDPSGLLTSEDGQPCEFSPTQAVQVIEERLIKAVADIVSQLKKIDQQSPPSDDTWPIWSGGETDGDGSEVEVRLQYTPDAGSESVPDVPTDSARPNDSPLLFPTHEEVVLPLEHYPQNVSFAVDDFDTPTTQASQSDVCAVTQFRMTAGDRTVLVDYVLNGHHHSEPLQTARYKIPQAIIDYFCRFTEYRAAK